MQAADTKKVAVSRACSRDKSLPSDETLPQLSNTANLIHCHVTDQTLCAIGQFSLGRPNLKIGKPRFVAGGSDFTHEMTVRFTYFAHVGHDGGSQTIGGNIV
jgi:hypothetical protein